MSSGSSRVMGGSHARHTRCVVWLAFFVCVFGVAGAQTEGTQRWPYTATTARSAYIYSSPAIGPDGTIYFGVAEDTHPPAGRLLALTQDGTPRWTGTLRDGFRTADFIEASPAIGADGTVYFGSWDGTFYALDGATGVKKWGFNVDRDKDVGSSTLPAAGYIVSSAAIGSDGTIYFGSSDALHPELAALHALRPDGTEIWRYVVGANVETDVALGSDGTIYFGAADGGFFALRPDRTLKWRREMDRPILSSPAIGPDGTIYVGNVISGLYAWSPAGALKWVFPTGSILGGASIAADGTIYVGSLDWNVYAIRPPDAEHASPWSRWFYEAGRPISSTPVVRGDGTVIVGLERDEFGHGGVVALNHLDGTKLWFYPVNESVRASPAIDAQGRIYVGAYDRQLHSIWGNNSTVSWFSAWPMYRRDVQHTGRSSPPPTGGRLINLSTRAGIAPGKPLIAGFGVVGTTTKYYLVRAVGPTLAGFGVTDPLADPMVTVAPLGDSTIVARNNDWEIQTQEGPDIAATAASVGAFPLPRGSKDAAVIPLLAPGLYTAQIGSGNGADGTALIEVYDPVPDAAGSLLLNLSTRGSVTASRPLIPGLVVRGSQPVRVLIRAAGPTLRVFGLTDVLARPRIEIRRRADNAVLHVNQGWTADGRRADFIAAGASVGAFPFQDNSADSAALLELAPGDYTITVTGADGGVGEVLVEVYYLLP